MHPLQMLHPVILASEAFGVALASDDWADEFLPTVYCPFMALQVAQIAEVANCTTVNGTLVRASVFVHVPPNLLISMVTLKPTLNVIAYRNADSWWNSRLSGHPGKSQAREYGGMAPGQEKSSIGPSWDSGLKCVSFAW